MSAALREFGPAFTAPETDRRMSEQNRLNLQLVRAVALILLFGVAGLRVASKANSRLPKSNPAHFTSAATKMEQTQPPAIPERAQLRLESYPVLEATAAQEGHWQEVELLPPIELVLASSAQHRAPPAIA